MEKSTFQTFKMSLTMFICLLLQAYAVEAASTTAPDYVDFPKYLKIYKDFKQVSDLKRENAKAAKLSAQAIDEEIATLKSSIANNQATIKNSQSSIEFMEQDIPRMEQDNERLAAIIIANRNTISENQVKIDGLDSRVRDLKEDIAVTRAEYEEVDTKRARVAQRLRRKNRDIDTISEQIRSNRQTLRALKQQLQDKRQKRDQVKKRIEQLKLELPLKKQKRQKAQEKLAAINTQITNLKQAIARLNEAVDRLKGKKQTATQELENARATFAPMKQKMQQLNTKITKATADYKSFSDKVVATQNKITNLKAQSAGFVQKIQELENKKFALEEKKRNKIAQKSKLEQEMTKLRQNFQKVSAKQNKKRKQLKALKDDPNAPNREARMQALRTEITKLAQRQKQITQKMKNTQSKIDAIPSQIAQIESNIQKTQNGIQRLEGKIQANVQLVIKNEQKLASLSEKMAQAKNKKDQLVSKKQQLKPKFDNAKAQVTAKKNALDTVVTKLQQKIDTRSQKKANLTQAKNKKVEVSNKIVTLTARIKTIKEKLPTLRQRLKKLNNQVIPDLIAKRDYQITVINNLEEDLRVAVAKRDQLKVRLARVTRQLNALSDDLADFVDAKNELENHILALESYNRRLAASNRANQRQIAENEQTSQDYSNEIIRLTKLIGDLLIAINNDQDEIAIKTPQAAAAWATYTDLDKDATQAEAQTAQKLAKYKEIKANYDEQLLLAKQNGQTQGDQDGDEEGEGPGTDAGDAYGANEGTVLGTAQGRAWGLNKGKQDGRDQGKKDGYRDGYTTANYEEGRAIGYEIGKEQAYATARAEDYPRAQAVKKQQLLSVDLTNVISVDNTANNIFQLAFYPSMMAPEVMQPASNYFAHQDNLCETDYIDFTNACLASYKIAYDKAYQKSYDEAFEAARVVAKENARSIAFEEHKMDRWQEGYDSTYATSHAKWTAIYAKEAQNDGQAQGIKEGNSENIEQARASMYTLGLSDMQEEFENNAVLRLQAASIKKAPESAHSTPDGKYIAGDKLLIDIKVANFGAVASNRDQVKIRLEALTNNVTVDGVFHDLVNIPGGTIANVSAVAKAQIKQTTVLPETIKIKVVATMPDGKGVITQSQVITIKTKLHMVTKMERLRYEAKPVIFETQFISLDVKNAAPVDAMRDYKISLSIPKINFHQEKNLGKIKAGQSKSVQFRYSLRDWGLEGKSIPVKLTVKYGPAVTSSKEFVVVGSEEQGCEWGDITCNDDDDW
ncbi:MAG: hypothetical protein ISR65_07215 [Bacteriovoracaceae bacterium]|nr:hypothetical protein [Bacteriovoracaceae bacterium]